MSTIPASQIVVVNPSVLSAGGTALSMAGLMLTTSWRVPMGSTGPTIASFASAASVGAYFGLNSNEYAEAQVYFASFIGNTQIPANLWIAQYPIVATAAYLRSGNVGSLLPLASLELLSGSLSIVMDGYTQSAASIDLSTATSYTAAAALIQTGLTAAEPTEASVTGSIAAESASVTGSISADILTVTVVGSGSLVPGAIITGTGIASGTQITAQLSGTAGGIGTYAVSIEQNIASETITASYGLMTVTVVGSGTISVGQTVTGSGVTASTVVTGLGTGLGLTGTYYVNLTQTVVSETLTLKATPLTVSFDSVSGAFVITSGITGTPSTAAFATGTLATPLLLTSATGALLSQGAAETTPSAFMASVIAQNQNWASFFTAFDPDNGLGNTQKLAFAAWTNTTNNRYAYACWDSDSAPTVSLPATGSLGYLISPNANNYSGTILVSEPSNLHHAAFISGWMASINFNALNGRANLCFRSQSGLVAGVSNLTAANNLLGNGYNYYGAYATAAQNWLFMYNGQISGPFLWADSYADQIYMNAQFQLALVNLLTAANTIPYNSAGYALIAAACQGVINQALNNGTIRPGVTLSTTQAALINQAVGANVTATIQNQGWYLYIQPATPQVRAARASPPISFWYTDGQSVQAITLSSIEIQ